MTLKELRTLARPSTLHLIYRMVKERTRTRLDRSHTFECTTCQYRTKAIAKAKKHAQGCFPETRDARKRTMRAAKKGTLAQF